MKQLYFNGTKQVIGKDCDFEFLDDQTLRCYHSRLPRSNDRLEVVNFEIGSEYLIPVSSVVVPCTGESCSLDIPAIDASGHWDLALTVSRRLCRLCARRALVDSVSAKLVIFEADTRSRQELQIVTKKLGTSLNPFDRSVLGLLHLITERLVSLTENINRDKSDLEAAEKALKRFDELYGD